MLLLLLLSLLPEAKLKLKLLLVGELKKVPFLFSNIAALQQFRALKDMDSSISAIKNHRPGSLKHTETVEKNLLPGKEEIEAERRASVSEEEEGKK